MGTSWALMSDRFGNHGLIIAKENGKRAAKTASQPAIKSKAQVQNHAINAGKAARPGANHRFEARPSLQSPQRSPRGRFSPTGFIYRDKHRAMSLLGWRDR